MKKFNVTVNGKAYAVEVEEVGGNQQAFAYVPVQPVVAPVQAAPTPQAASAPAQRATPTPKAQSKSSDKVSGEMMEAPMPGTILEIKVSEGQTVKAGEIVVILEAMKMENELAAPVDGTVAKIYTSKGESVNAGDSILTIA